MKEEITIYGGLIRDKDDSFPGTVYILGHTPEEALKKFYELYEDLYEENASSWGEKQSLKAFSKAVTDPWEGLVIRADGPETVFSFFEMQTI